MKTFLFSCAALIALSMMGTTNAEAGGHSHGSHSHGYHSNGYHFSPTSYYQPTSTPTYSSWHRPPTWHDTSHYDYHPAEIRRHGNHFHYTPGHYDLHRTGHFHP